MGAVHNFEHQCSALEQMKGGQEAHNAVDLGFSLQSVGYSAPSPECHLSLRLIGSHTDSFHYGPILTSIHDYWKNHTLTRWTFVSKVMSLLFNMLSRLVIAFLLRKKRLLIS